MSCEVVAVLALVNQLLGRRDHSSGLVNSVFLGIVSSSADGKRHVDFLAVDRGDHIVVALEGAVAYPHIVYVQAFEHFGDVVLDKSLNLAVFVGAAVRQVIVEIAHAQAVVLA